MSSNTGVPRHCPLCRLLFREQQLRLESMHSPSTCDEGGTMADSETVPSTGQRKAAELSLTPCLLKVKAVLSPC